VIKLAPGVNVLVGRTDVGKSAVLRALRWVALNQPKGAGFVRWGKSGVGVAVTAGNVTVSRVRKGKESYYTVGKARFDALNATVPPEASDALKLAEVNFQRQIDPPFWFTLSPGQVAKELNRVVDLSLIDQALDRVGRSVRSKKSELALTEKRYQEAKARRDELSWIVQYRQDKAELDNLDLDWRESQTRASRLGQLVRMVSDTRSLSADAENLCARGVSVVEAGDRLGVVSARVRKLSYLLKKVRLVRNGMIDLPDFTPVVQLREAGDKIAETRRNLEMLLQELKAKGDELCQATDDLALRETELVKLAGNRCPTCGRSPFFVQTSISPKERRLAGRRRDRPGSTSKPGVFPN
jgi:DNA repair ATPase RecN